MSLIALIGLALLFDYTNGFHDSANAVSTIVATRVLTPRWAVLWAAGFNFIAFLIFGTAVADTVGSTVKSDYFSLAVVFAALLGAVTWNFVSWHLGIPTSSSHALIGGLVGAGLAAGGWDAIKGASLQKTVVFIVVSPIAGLVLGGLLMALLRLLLSRRDVRRTERGFRVLQLASSAAVSLGHGGNDAQKTMGVIAALLVATGHLNPGGGKLPVPLWVVLAAHLAIAAGTFSGGWRIVRTMGFSITPLRPVSGFAAETGAAIALFGSTAVGAPVSTTHTVAGAVSGVGVANRGTGTNWRVFARMAVAWVVTLPAAAVMSALMWELTERPPHAVSFVLDGAILVVLIGLLAAAIRRAPRAADLENEQLPAGEEREVPLRPGAGSVISGGSDTDRRAARADDRESSGSRDDARASRAPL